MSAENIWHHWQDFLEPAPNNSDSDDEEVALGRIYRQQDEEIRRLDLEQDHVNMAQAQQVDMAALLAQFMAAHLEQQQREVARDAATVARDILNTYTE